MANYSELLNDINDAIYENNDQEIDALEVRAILREMVTSLGSGFLFKGIATPSSPSGTGTYEPDQNVFYLATTAGTYTYLGGLVVAAGEVAFLCFDGTWTKKSTALLSTGSIVDNTTTDDATKPLSAKQGKVLADAGAATAAEVAALGQKVDTINGWLQSLSYTFASDGKTNFPLTSPIPIGAKLKVSAADFSAYAGYVKLTGFDANGTAVGSATNFLADGGSIEIGPWASVITALRIHTPSGTFVSAGTMTFTAEVVGLSQRMTAAEGNISTLQTSVAANTTSIGSINTILNGNVSKSAACPTHGSILDTGIRLALTAGKTYNFTITKDVTKYIWLYFYLNGVQEGLQITFDADDLTMTTSFTPRYTAEYAIYYYFSAASKGTRNITISYTDDTILQRIADVAKFSKIWTGKNIALYGDSITQQCGNDSINYHSWAYYLKNLAECDFTIRGWAATLLCHKYYADCALGVDRSDTSIYPEATYGPAPSNWYEFDANGIRKSVGQGTTITSYTGMCDWQRIITQFPATIKDTIDAVILFGGANDAGAGKTSGQPLGDFTFNEYETLPTDPENYDVAWCNSAYYNGGDYNIKTVGGAVCSAIMKLQAWMPQAIIIVATPLSGSDNAAGAGNNAVRPVVINGSLTLRDYAQKIKEGGVYLSTPVIDVNANDGINWFNRAHYLVDGVHPATATGGGIVDGASVEHFDGSIAVARCMYVGLNGIYPKFGYIPWTE